MLTSHQVSLFVENLNQWVSRYLQLEDSLESPDQVGLIHDFRISTRRLLAVEPMLRHKTKTQKWRKKARHLIQRLNRTRDLHILRKRFSQHEQLADKIQRDLGEERRNWPLFLQQLDGFPRKYLLKSVGYYSEYALKHSHELTRHLGDRWNVLYQDTIKYLLLDEYYDVSVLHKLRVSYKQLRYFVELLMDAAIFADVNHMDLKSWQDDLGEIQDLRFIIDWLAQQDITGNMLDELRKTELTRAEAFWANRDEMRSFIESINHNLLRNTSS